jgi:orotate phosphoribosyltransferase
MKILLKRKRELDFMDSALTNYFITKYKKEGEFKLSSGDTSNVYWDFRPLVLDSYDLLLFSRLFFKHIEDMKGVVLNNSVNIIGLEFWGAIFASLIPYLFLQSFITHIPIILRKEKEHGIQDRLIGINKAKRTDPFFLIDDVITTGKNIQSAITYLAERRIKVSRIIVLLNRGQIKNISAIEVDSIFQFSE